MTRSATCSRPSFDRHRRWRLSVELAGGVAHDFNNLLTSILGYCDLLLEDLPSDDPRRVDLKEIQQAGQQAAGLTRQLLTFSRKEIVEPTLVNLNAVVTNVQAMLQRLIGEDVTLVAELAPSLAAVKADAGQIEQVVMNLAVNARDAMPTGGTLTITTANVHLDDAYARMHPSMTPGPYVALTVSDTGTGMTPQVLARLYEPFFTTKAVGKGTGLGLATVRGAVARSGGSVDVSTTVGKGTSFRIYFPRADAVEASAETGPVEVPSRGRAETVLVVEDVLGLRELTRRILKRAGYTVLVAANAQEALDLAETHPIIDLILTDVVMPGASGPEMTHQLLAQRPALKIIYMSGYTEDAIVDRGVVSAEIAFLHKPFTAEVLEHKVHEVLSR